MGSNFAALADPRTSMDSRYYGYAIADDRN